MSPHKTNAGESEGRHWIMGTEAFEKTMPHHEGIKALWETKWKFPVRDGRLELDVPFLKLTAFRRPVHQECISIPRRKVRGL